MTNYKNAKQSLASLLDEQQKQIKEMADILHKLATEMNDNRELIGKNASLTKKICETLKAMNEGQIF